MKKIVFLLFLASFALGAQVFSQTSEATLTDEGAVKLNEEQPLQSHYTINASQFEFESDQEALEYFASKSSNHVVYRINRSSGEINMYLQLKREPDWSLQDWNTYLTQNKIAQSESTHQTSK